MVYQQVPEIFVQSLLSMLESFLKRVSTEFATAALERLKNGPILVLNGIPAVVYQQVPEIFVQSLLSMLESFLNRVPSSDSSSVALVLSIDLSGSRRYRLWRLKTFCTT